MKKFLCVFFVIFSFVENLVCENVKQNITTITIKNARETNYKKSEETGNDTIILEGSVELSVEKDNKTSEIKANKVTYDRKTEMLYAEGHVEITTKSSSSGGETSTANSLLLNTSTLEGVFDGGKIAQTQSDALNLPSGSTLIVFSQIFGKGKGSLISLKNSSLTFCDDENPHWKINASRTWLLPGGEFAFLNALLFVGSVPVLYFPAFYYPKDELLFNPVFSIKPREGYSIQTTTYIYGRKPLDTSSNSSSSSTSSSSTTSASDKASAESLKALYNFMKPSKLKEQKLEGIVLHNLDEDFKGDTTNFLKLMGDWYSNLGAMVGLEGKFQPSKEYITNLSFNFNLGFSNTIFKYSQNGKYYPSSPTGQKYYDYSSFLGLKLPFRYAAGLDFTLSKPFKLTISLPLYSDPFFGYDFKTNRSETMDWISYFLDISANSKNQKEQTVSEVSSFTWQINSSVSPTLPTFIKPYISSFSFSTNSSVNISSMTASLSELNYEDEQNSESSWKNNTPTRRFYYPSLVTPLNSTFSISGTIFSYPIKSNKTKKTLSFPITLNKPQELKSEKEIQKELEEAEKQKELKTENSDNKEKTENSQNKSQNKEELIQPTLPNLDYSIPPTKVAEGITYNLGYTASATYNAQLSYASSNLKKSDDFDWKNIRAFMYTLKMPLSLNSKLNYGGEFFSMSNQISYNPVWQEHPFVSDDEKNGGYSQKEKQNLLLADYKAEIQDVVNTNTVSFKPFYYLPLISDSSVAWNSTIKIFRKKFTGDAENPNWDNEWTNWDSEEFITVNSLTANLTATQLENKFKQNISFTMIMPPLLKKYIASLNLTFPYLTASVSTGFEEKTKDDVPEKEKWKKSPLTQSSTLKFPTVYEIFNFFGKNSEYLKNSSFFNSSLNLSQSFTYNTEEKIPDNLKFSASWNTLQFSYLMSYSEGYDLEEEGWMKHPNKEFLPYSLSFSFSPKTKEYKTWFNRISYSFALSTSITADLLRPTNSYFLFSPSISFKITDFFTITFSSTSRNSVLYWYFADGDFFNEAGNPLGNICYDLINSFRFDDENLRKASGFKLKSLNFAINHELHDWTFNMTLKIEPRIVKENNISRYDFSPYFTLGIVWKPMESLKTNIVDEYGKWKLE